jgi:glycosyltransferase involved in cell wall biosynthesis
MKTRPLAPLRRLPVLFVLRGLHGTGPVRVALTLLRHLDRERFAPGLFLLSRHDAMAADVPPDVNVHLGWPGAAASSSVPWRIGSALALTRAALGYPLLVAAVEWQPTTATDVVARALRKPVVGWVHAQLDHFVREPRALAALDQRYVRMAEVVCCSEPTAAALARVSPRARATVIPNALDLERVRAAAQAPLPSWAAAAWRRPVVLAVGRIAPEKDHATLVRAHALAYRRAPHHLVIVGGGDRAALMQLAHTLGVGDSVFLPGYEVNPFPLIARARMLALSSSSEGLPTVVLEAQALGVPVVTTNSGGVRDMVAHDAGVLVPVGDATALSEGIVALLVDDHRHALVARNGALRCEASAVGAVVPRWEAILAAAVR